VCESRENSLETAQKIEAILQHCSNIPSGLYGTCILYNHTFIQIFNHYYIQQIFNHYYILILIHNHTFIQIFNHYYIQQIFNHYYILILIHCIAPAFNFSFAILYYHVSLWCIIMYHLLCLYYKGNINSLCYFLNRI